MKIELDIPERIRLQSVVVPQSGLLENMIVGREVFKMIDFTEEEAKDGTISQKDGQWYWQKNFGATFDLTEKQIEVSRIGVTEYVKMFFIMNVNIDVHSVLLAEKLGIDLRAVMELANEEKEKQGKPVEFQEVDKSK